MENKLDFQEHEPWRSMNDVCEYIGCTRDTLLTWIREKGLPGVQIGRTWRFKLSEVDAWLRENNEAAHQQCANTGGMQFL